jgi:hypothetical protein
MTMTELGPGNAFILSRSLLINRANFAMVKEPSMMSTQRIPSKESTGSIEYLDYQLLRYVDSHTRHVTHRRPRMKNAWRTACRPRNAQARPQYGNLRLQALFVNHYQLVGGIISPDLCHIGCPLCGTSFDGSLRQLKQSHIKGEHRLSKFFIPSSCYSHCGLMPAILMTTKPRLHMCPANFLAIRQERDHLFYLLSLG